MHIGAFDFVHDKDEGNLLDYFSRDQKCYNFGTQFTSAIY